MIVLNGPPGCGKSTLARMYAEDHPLALNLDIDRIRSLIGRWRDDPDAQEMIDHRGGRQELSAMYDRLISVIAVRPAAKIVPTSSGQVDQAYRDFLHSLA